MVSEYKTKLRLRNLLFYMRLQENQGSANMPEKKKRKREVDDGRWMNRNCGLAYCLTCNILHLFP